MKSTRVYIRLVSTQVLLRGVWLCARTSPLNYRLDIAELPRPCQKSINTICTDKLSGQEAEARIQVADDNLIKINPVFDLPSQTRQDDWQIKITDNYI
jgi:hypothetical protein